MSVADPRSGKKKYPQRIGSTIHCLMSKWRRMAGESEDHLTGVWLRAVGAHVAKYTVVERLSGRRLIVRVANAAWMNELTYLKERINIEAQKVFADNGIIVESISFKLGKAPRISEPPPDAPPSGK